MKRLAISIMLTAAVSAVSAQGWDVGGVVMDPSAVTAMDMFNWSQSSMGVGTARSAAMGGAVTSLGGDISAMSVNPAGLGMYRQNDVALSPMIGVTHSRTADTDRFGDGNSMTRFSVANFGVVLKAYESSGKVVAVNIGFGYNRLADFNRRTSFARGDNRSSVAEAFARQLSNTTYTGYDFNGGENPDFDWWNIDPRFWGAALGYKCGLVDDSGGSWAPDMFGSEPSVGHYAGLVSKGALGEYAFSAGMNIDNKLYIGLTMGIQDLRQRREYYYGETYDYPEGAEPAGNRLLYMNYNQTSVAAGAGVNFKFGLTYRPVEALRIGIAVHTPTWYTVDYRYQGAMMAHMLYDDPNDDPDRGLQPTYADASTETWSDSGGDSWHFRSPAKLLLGVSYTIGQRAIVSVDYERSWYNTIRSQRTPVGRGVYNDFFRSEFRGANTLRAGVEFKPLTYMALRAGYGFNGSMVRDNGTIYSSPVAYNTQYVSAGVGFVLSNTFYVDLAYRYVAQRETPYMLYYAYDTTGAAGAGTSGEYSTQVSRHDILLTFGFRF